jgi:polar amino acid transport system substrate-binding protein
MRMKTTATTKRAMAVSAGSLLAVVVAGAGAATAGASATAATAIKVPATAIKVPAKYGSGITMAMDATYAPDEFTTANNTIVGFDADLGYALGKVMGVKVTLSNVTFDTIIPAIEDGKYDVGNSSFTDTKLREQQVTFIDYFKAGEGFYEKATAKTTFNGLASLCKHSVAVESGTTEQSDAESQAKKCHVTVLSYNNQNEANLAVSDGRADLGFADSQVAAYQVHLSGGQFKLTGTPFETAPYGFIVAKNSGLAQPLLAAVKKLMADGQYKMILDRWGVEQGAIANPGINLAGS